MDNEIEVIKNRIKNKRLGNLSAKSDSTPKIKYIKNLLSRTLITIILILLSIIYTNSNESNLSAFKEKFLNKTFSFAPFKDWYQKKFGNVLPIEVDDNSTLVFSDNLAYLDIENYQDGFKFKVNNNSIINNLTSGIVVYIGEKENYGNVLIVQGIDGVDIWYGNITNSNLSLYDYVEKNQIIGESNGEILYMVLIKDGEYLNYEEYIKQDKN